MPTIKQTYEMNALPEEVFEALVNPEIQEWCYDQWEHPSKVTFTLKAKGKKTIVELLHEDVPEKSVNSIADGWDAYYLGAMQEMFNENKLTKKVL